MSHQDGDGPARRVLDAATADGLASGYALYATDGVSILAAHGGEDALGSPVDEFSRFHTYCAMKPLLAIVIAALVDRGDLAINDSVGSIVDGVGGQLAELTVDGLLSHSTGVTRPEAIECSTLSRDERIRIALGSPLSAPPLGRGESLYTECAAWIILGQVVEALTDQPLAQAAESLVLAPLGCSSEFDLDSSDADSRFRMNVSTRRGSHRPLLIERTDAFRWEDNPGYGGRSSMRGLASLAFAVDRGAAGHPSIVTPTTARWLVSTAGRRFDRALQRECEMGRGWLRSLDDFQFGGSADAEWFGSIGMAGMTVTWANPDAGFACAFHLNGVADESSLAEWIRPAIVQSVTKYFVECRGV